MGPANQHQADSAPNKAKKTTGLKTKSITKSIANSTGFITMTVISIFGACAVARPSNQCRGRERERCLWQLATEEENKLNRNQKNAERSRRNVVTDSKTFPDREAPPFSEPSGEALTPWTLMTDLLQDVSQVMIDGMDPAVIDSQARTWCAAEPATRETNQGIDWTCVLRNPPTLFNREFVLEFGDGGVISLTAFDLSGQQSNSLVTQAKGRWHNWCLAGEFTALEGTTYDELHRCAIPGGPYLVLGRFNRDVEADLWQVSIAILATN